MINTKPFEKIQGMCLACTDILTSMLFFFKVNKLIIYMNSVPYNPLNKTYKYTWFLNQANHIKNKTEAASCIDSNIIYTKSLPKKRSKKKKSHSLLKKNQIQLIDNPQLHKKQAQELQLMYINNTQKVKQISQYAKNQRNLPQFNKSVRTSNMVTQPLQIQHSYSHNNILSIFDYFGSIQKNNARKKTKKSKRKKIKLKSETMIGQYAKPHLSIHKNQSFDKRQTFKIAQDNIKLAKRLQNASCHVFPRKSTDGLLNGTQSNLLQRFEKNHRKFSKIRQIFNNKNIRNDRLILNRKDLMPKTLSQISQQLDKLYLNPLVKHNKSNKNLGQSRNKQWTKYFVEGQRYQPSKLIHRQYSVEKIKKSCKTNIKSEDITISQQCPQYV